MDRSISVGKKRRNGSIPVKTTMVFAAQKAADSQVIVHRGGARSSKSYSIMQWIIESFFIVPKVKILILRKYAPSLRTSCKPLFYEIIDQYGLRDKIREFKLDANIFSPVDGMIHFSGLDDPEKIRSSDFNLVWMEEASQFTMNDFINLKLRLSSPIVGDWRNKIILSFNPVDEHSWIKSDLLDPEKEDLAEIVSNYRMNPFLSNDYRRTIEALKDQNENYWRIFAEGQWGRLENIIYTNWRTVSELPEGEEIFGLDFGFSSPTCLVRVLVDGMVAGVEQKIYREELTNSQLIEQMNIIMTPQQKANCPIYADSEDTNRIEEIKNAGFRIYLADKKVVAGINHVRQYQLLIKNDSDDIIKEISGYSHKTDHKGNVMEDPIKGFDHSLDACRYAIFTHYSRMSRHSPNIKVLDWSDDAARDSWDDD